MSDDCPTCERPSLGGQIVELPHPHGDTVTYAIACPRCGTVYQSNDAREQMQSGGDGDTYTVVLNRDQLLRTRIALINTAKEWDDQGDPETAQVFRDTLKPYSFKDPEADGP